MMFAKLFVLLMVTSFWCTCVRGANERCIKGLYHKESPSPETAEYKACTPWKNLTCCNTRLDREVDMNNSPKLYNDSWHRCGNLSRECLKFWKRQECFYQCSPYIYQWQHSKYKEAITGVPVCSTECDAWYDACKNDTICVENVLEDYNETEAFGKICPAVKGQRDCKTYVQMYGSGRALCEKMWGSSYNYAEPNAQQDNCMVMWFEPGKPNPNANVLKPGNKSALQTALAVLFLLPAFQVLAFFL